MILINSNSHSCKYEFTSQCVDLTGRILDFFFLMKESCIKSNLGLVDKMLSSSLVKSAKRDDTKK